jgi:hypothetical protein
VLVVQQHEQVQISKSRFTVSPVRSL